MDQPTTMGRPGEGWGGGGRSDGGGGGPAGARGGAEEAGRRPGSGGHCTRIVFWGTGDTYARAYIFVPKKANACTYGYPNFAQMVLWTKALPDIILHKKGNTSRTPEVDRPPMMNFFALCI